ncbi:MAG: GIY-YIG nuclease family protein [Bdellovibrionales bacterium]
MKQFFVYILTNDFGNVMYVGVTNDLERRLQEHKSGLVKGFSKKYNLRKLVYFEDCFSSVAAIAREKEIKGWRREKKDKLVETLNPEWRDLSVDDETSHMCSG